jgi:hypothetical protein
MSIVYEKRRPKPSTLEGSRPAAWVTTPVLAIAKEASNSCAIRVIDVRPVAAVLKDDDAGTGKALELTVRLLHRDEGIVPPRQHRGGGERGARLSAAHNVCGRLN